MAFRVMILILLIFLTACQQQSVDQDIILKRENSQLSLETRKATVLESDSKEELKLRDFHKLKTTALTSYVEDVGTLASIGVSGITHDNIAPEDIFMKPQKTSYLSNTSAIHPSYLILTFDNDIFAETDYYYTNGFSVGLVHPKLNNRTFGRILAGLGYKSLNTTGLRIHQFMFTPQNPEAIEIDYNDRPFAGVLLVEYFKLSQLVNRSLNFHASLSLGVIGKASMAQALQTVMHQLEPKGWDYQIGNDLLLNYDISLEKLVFSGRFWQLSGMIEAGLGSYQTYGGGALQLRIGLLNGFKNSYLPELENVSSTNKVGSFWFFIQPAWHYVVHNASLNGGFLNKNNAHYFTHDEIRHNLARFSAGFSWHYRKIGLGIRWTQIGPEFRTANKHNWGSMSLLYTL
ncbi:MAG: lipid A deacylase LpxR family protein [Bacteroidales bacterium]|jgi:hypothetical protein|nr:lipid A deacylase LpxR family protein [Bacteroidales bacterium]